MPFHERSSLRLRFVRPACRSPCNIPHYSPFTYRYTTLRYAVLTAALPGRRAHFLFLVDVPRLPCHLLAAFCPQHAARTCHTCYAHALPNE